MSPLIWRCAAAGCLIVLSPMVYAKADCRLLVVTAPAKVWIGKALKEISAADAATVFDRCDEMRLQSGQIQLHYSSVERVSDTATIGRDAKEYGEPFGQLVQFARGNEAFTKRMRVLLNGPPRSSTGGRNFDASKCVRLLPCGMIVRPESDLHIPIERTALQSARLVSSAGTDSAGAEIAGSELIIRQSALSPGPRYRIVLRTSNGEIEQPFSVGDDQWSTKMRAAIAREEEKSGGDDDLARLLARLQAMRDYGLQFEGDQLGQQIERQYPFLSK